MHNSKFKQYLKTYNCAECPLSKRALRHCTEEKTGASVFDIDGTKFYFCPGRINIQLSQTLNDYTQIWNCLQVGVMPVTGGLDKQANKTLEIVNYIGATKVGL